MSETNIFIVHSPFQMFIANHMIESMPDFGGAANWLVSDMTVTDQSPLSDNWTRHTDIRPPLGPSVLANPRRIRAAVGELGDHLIELPSVNLFLANVQWPLNNGLYRLIRSHTEYQHVRHCNFPEGIGSLRLCYQDRRQRLRNRLKALMGYLGGSPYLAFKTDAMGLSVADKVYSLMPSVVRPLTTAPVIRISKPVSSGGDVDGRSCVFLGQHNKFMSTVVRKVLAIRAAEFVIALGYSRHLYKPHHYDQADIEQTVFLDRGFELLEDVRPIEEVFANQCAGCTVSYNSSALVHVKAMFGDSARSISFGAETVHSYSRERDEDFAAILDLFRQAGIEVWRADASHADNGAG